MGAAPTVRSPQIGVVARLRSWPALAVLVGWTIFLWASRLRNVVDNDELDDWGLAWRVAVVVVFVSLAVAAAGGRAIGVLVWWTVGFWVVRGGGILLDDHDAAFTAIHTALMVVSIGAAMWVWRTRSR